MGDARQPFLVLGAACAFAFPHANAQETPPITPRRQLEDYRYLATPENRSGAWWERLKYIPLGRGGDAPFLTFGGEVRFRYELIDNTDFGSGLQDTGGYLLTRYMPYASLIVPCLPGGTELEFFGQAVAAFSDGDARGAGPIDEDGFDILQAFVKLDLPLGNGKLTLQGGRQIMAFGTERLLGTRYGPNLPLSFDGGFLRWRDAAWDIHAFYFRPVQTEPDPIDNLATERQQIWGLYATRELEDFDPLFVGAYADFYYFGYFDADTTYASGSGRELRHTLGTRFFGERKVPGGTLDWNYEGMLQFGSFGDGSILAWSAGTETGYTLDASFAPHLSLRANVISGQLHQGDANLQTFNPLFPKGKYFGELTPVGPYNLINVLGTLSLAPTPETAFSVQGGPYWRYSPADGVYGIGGNVLREPGDSNARFIGTQLEFVGEWHPVRELGFLVSYSLFAPGAFIHETGPADTIHFFAIEAVFQF